MNKILVRTAIASAVFAILSSTAIAGGHNAAIREAMQDPKKMEAFMEDRLDHETGLEGKEAQLGQGVVALVQELGGKLDLSKSSDEELGLYILTAVKTMNHNWQSYKHKINFTLKTIMYSIVDFILLGCHAYTILIN